MRYDFFLSNLITKIWQRPFGEDLYLKCYIAWRLWKEMCWFLYDFHFEIYDNSFSCQKNILSSQRLWIYNILVFNVINIVHPIQRNVFLYSDVPFKYFKYEYCVRKISQHLTTVKCLLYHLMPCNKFKMQPRSLAHFRASAIVYTVQRKEIFKIASLISQAYFSVMMTSTNEKHAP